MATTLTGLTAKVVAALRATTGKTEGLSVTKDLINLFFSRAYVLGDADGEANIFWHHDGELADTSSDEIELAASVEGERITDAFGDFVVFAKIDAIMIKNNSTLAATIEVGPTALTPWLGPWKTAEHPNVLKPGGSVLLVADKAGWAVAADVLLLIENMGAPIAEYELGILGRVAA